MNDEESKCPRKLYTEAEIWAIRYLQREPAAIGREAWFALPQPPLPHHEVNGYDIRSWDMGWSNGWMAGFDAGRSQAEEERQRLENDPADLTG